MKKLFPKFVTNIFKYVDGAKLSPNSGDIVNIYHPKPGMFGLLLSKNILLVDYRSVMSYRVEYGNLGFHKKVQTASFKPFFDLKLLESYFLENCDNPHAIIYLMSRISKLDFKTPLTQVPPINLKYKSDNERHIKLIELLSLAEPADFVFSRSIENSKPGDLIRHLDKGQFSHVGTYIGNGITMDAGPDGVLKNSLEEIGADSHIALYKIRGISAAQREVIVEFTKKTEGAGYNWIGVFILALKLKLGISKRKGSQASVNELLFSDKLELVTYV